MLNDIRRKKPQSDTGGIEKGSKDREQELDILMRHQLEVDLKYAFNNI